MSFDLYIPFEVSINAICYMYTHTHIYPIALAEGFTRLKLLDYVIIASQSLSCRNPLTIKKYFCCTRNCSTSYFMSWFYRPFHSLYLKYNLLEQTSCHLLQVIRLQTCKMFWKFNLMTSHMDTLLEKEVS